MSFSLTHIQFLFSVSPRTFKRSFIAKVLVSLFLAVGLTLSAQAKTFKLVSEPYPPFEYQENGKDVGMDVEILKAAASKAGIELKIDFLPWSRALDQVKSGEADGIFSLLKNAEREGFLIFPATPLYVGKNVFFAAASFTGKVESLADLKGKTVGIVNGNSYGEQFDKATGFTKDGVADQDTLIKKLLAGRNELIVTAEKVGWYSVKQQGGKDVKALPFVVSKENYYIGLSKKSANGKELADKLGKALADLEKSGVLTKIRKKYSGN